MTRVTASGWCSNYADFALSLAQWFIYLAFAVALVETGLLLWAKVRALLKEPEAADSKQAESLRAAGVDPVKLLDALKGLLETLKGLPAWIGIFLAGLALLWIAGREPEGCTPPEARCAKEGTQKCSPQRPNALQPGDASNTQAAVNTQ